MQLKFDKIVHSKAYGTNFEYYFLPTDCYVSAKNTGLLGLLLHTLLTREIS